MKDVNTSLLILTAAFTPKARQVSATLYRLVSVDVLREDVTHKAVGVFGSASGVNAAQDTPSRCAAHRGASAT